jgi:ParG
MGSEAQISTFTVKIESDLLARFKAACAVQQTSMSDVTRKMVVAYIDQKGEASSAPSEPPKPRASEPSPPPKPEPAPEPPEPETPPEGATEGAKTPPDPS